MISNAIKGKDFTGQNLYVGIDTHFKSWAVSIYSDEFELKTFSQQPDVDQLINHLRTNYPQANYHLAYEAGFSGFWIQRDFARKGIDCQVIHPADVPGSDKENKRKTDRVDCRKIAGGLKNKDLNAIFIPDEQIEADRALIRTRVNMVRDITSVKNRIKAFLKIKGIIIPGTFKTGNWTKRFIQWLHRINITEPSGKATLVTYIEEIEFLMVKEKQLQSTIRALSLTEKYEANMKMLTSVPSIGLIAGMTLLTELGNIKRFKKIDHLCSYCGLTPNCYSSEETERIGGKSRRGNLHLATCKK